MLFSEKTDGGNLYLVHTGTGTVREEAVSERVFGEGKEKVMLCNSAIPLIFPVDQYQHCEAERGGNRFLTEDLELGGESKGFYHLLASMKIDEERKGGGDICI